MNERGAKHFAFISRSGADKLDAARLVENIKRAGATTQVFRADASDEEAVRRVVLELNSTGRIRGVVHAATVLKDGMFEHMDHQSFVGCVNAIAADEGGHQSSGSGSGSDSNDFNAAIKEASSEGRPEAILAVIAKHMAKRMSSILIIPVDEFELDGPSLGSYGLDSMIGVEMRTWIFKEFGLDYPFQKLLAPTLSFMSLAGVVTEKMGLIADLAAAAAE